MIEILYGLFITLFLLCFYFLINGIFDRFSVHNHKWQSRGINRYGGITYRVCLKCRKAQKRVNKISEDEKWEYCDSMPELDSQFDENDNYIF